MRNDFNEAIVQSKNYCSCYTQRGFYLNKLPSALCLLTRMTITITSTTTTTIAVTVTTANKLARTTTADEDPLLTEDSPMPITEVRDGFYIYL